MDGTSAMLELDLGSRIREIVISNSFKARPLGFCFQSLYFEVLRNTMQGTPTNCYEIKNGNYIEKRLFAR